MADEKSNTSDSGDEQLDIGQAAEKAGQEAGDKDAKKGGEEEKSSSEGKEKTYTEADWKARETEWNKRYGNLDSKLSKVTTDMQSETERLSSALAEAEERASNEAAAALLRQVEEDGGNTDTLKAVFAREKALKAAEREVENRKKQLDERDTILAEAGKGKTATDLVTELGLDSSAIDELLSQDSPEKMRNKALELKLEKVQADANPVIETDSNRGGEKINLEERLKSDPYGTLGEAMEGKI